MMKKLGYMLKRHTQTSSAILLIHFICVAGMKNLLFGSDEGADALNVLENSLRKEPDLDCADFPQMLIETMWGMKYIAMDSILEEDVRAQLLVDEMSTIQSNMITYATAFGQIKVMDKISHKLKKMGLNALARHQLTAKFFNGVTVRTHQYFKND